MIGRFDETKAGLDGLTNSVFTAPQKHEAVALLTLLKNGIRLLIRFESTLVFED